MTKDESPKRELSSSALNDFSACSLTRDPYFRLHSDSSLYSCNSSRLVLDTFRSSRCAEI